jgi:TRAP-type uncharacterized transport system fused permease subunit
MLLFGVADKPLEMIWMMISSLIGITAVAAGVSAFLKRSMGWPERILFFVGGIGLVTPGIVTDAIGAGLIAIGVFIQLTKKEKLRSA